MLTREDKAIWECFTRCQGSDTASFHAAHRKTSFFPAVLNCCLLSPRDGDLFLQKVAQRVGRAREQQTTSRLPIFLLCFLWAILHGLVTTILKCSFSRHILQCPRFGDNIPKYWMHCQKPDLGSFWSERAILFFSPSDRHRIITESVMPSIWVSHAKAIYHTSMCCLAISFLYTHRKPQKPSLTRKNFTHDCNSFYHNFYHVSILFCFFFFFQEK